MLRFALIVAICATMLGCTPVSTKESTVLMLGDSMFAWNRTGGGGVGANLARTLERSVEDRSITGAHVNVTGPNENDPKRSITAQYGPGKWQWVVINGGANDLLFECGCGRCDRTLDDIISPDLKTGALVDLVAKARADGARVMLVGYHAGRAGGHYFSGCKPEVTALVQRQLQFAARTRGVYMVRARKALDSNNSAHFAFDRVHPSKLGSRLIADLIGAEILRIERRR